MNAYLSGIADFLIGEHRLRVRQDSEAERVWIGRQFGEMVGTRRRGQKSVSEFRLCHFKQADYLDFQERSFTRTYRKGRSVKEVLDRIDLHVTVNASGSIRRLYKHGTDGEVRSVRTLSLKNYYTVGDDRLAVLLMVNEDRLAWLQDLPVTYYPVANKDLRAIGSVEAFLGHFAGPGVVIPRRILEVLGAGQTVTLLQLVPGNHLNDMATTIKQRRVRAPTAYRAVLSYYQGILGEACPHWKTLYHYLDCCRHIERKINLRLRSERRMMEERDELSRIRQLDKVVEIRTSKAFILPQTDHGDVQLELIDRARRLWDESQQMHSCVDTYCRRINEGACAIYHVRYDGEGYTLELGRDDAGTLRVAQLKGVSNSAPPPGLKQRIARIIRKLTARQTQPLPPAAGRALNSRAAA